MSCIAICLSHEIALLHFFTLRVCLSSPHFHCCFISSQSTLLHFSSISPKSLATPTVITGVFASTCMFRHHCSLRSFLMSSTNDCNGRNPQEGGGEEASRSLCTVPCRSLPRFQQDAEMDQTRRMGRVEKRLRQTESKKDNKTTDGAWRGTSYGAARCGRRRRRRSLSLLYYPWQEGGNQTKRDKKEKENVASYHARRGWMALHHQSVR